MRIVHSFMLLPSKLDRNYKFQTIFICKSLNNLSSSIQIQKVANNDIVNEKEYKNSITSIQFKDLLEMQFLPEFLLSILLLGVKMTQRYMQALIQADLKATFLLLKNAFPNLQKVPLRQSVTSSPFLAPLAKRLQLNIPIDAYPSQCIALYKQINDDYLRHALNLDIEQTKQSNVSDVSFIFGRPEEKNQQIEGDNKKNGKRVTQRNKINFLELATFIKDFNVEERSVSQQLIEMGRIFKSWQVQQISTMLSPKPAVNKKEPKQESADIKFGRQQKEDVKIVFGKNISLQCKIMRHEIINRAHNNKLLSQNTQLSEIEKKEIEMNFILNRITEEYFQDFREQLTIYAQNQRYSFTLSQKILEKSMEEHNFITIYTKLVKSLKNQRVALEGSKIVLFRHIFVQKLQEVFYEMVRNAEWKDKEQHLKKQLIGLCMFLGELFGNKFLSVNIFPDIFYQLLHKYVIQYHSNAANKSFYFQTYIQCIIKIIEKMSTHYEKLIKKNSTGSLETVVNQILNLSNNIHYNFSHICDYVEVLKIINARLPSQRFKITFLLEDFRCSKAIKKQLDNSEADVVKSILAIDINQHHDVERIPCMIAKINSEIMMKDFFFQFAEGNIKQVNKHIEIFKIMAESPNITEATLKSFKENVEGLYLIDSDFPFLAQGIAKIMRIVCDLKKIDYYELQLGQDSHEDEDVREFLQKVEEKYFKMSMQD